MASLQSAKQIIGDTPRARWGLFCDGSSARKLEAEGKLREAGVAYVECGRHRNAVRVARALLDGSDYLGASRIIVALWKKTGDDCWKPCAARIARKAEEEGKLEDAATIYEEAGFPDMAALVRKDIRLSSWMENIGRK